MNNINHFKKILLDEKEKLTHGLKLSEDVRQSRSPELSLYDNHPADTASEQFDRQRAMALEVHHENELNEIEDALTAIENGTYGFCKICGTKIPEERLEVVPASLYCVEHSNKQKLSKDRPVEEKVLQELFDNPYDQNDTLMEAVEQGSSDTESEM